MPPPTARAHALTFAFISVLVLILATLACTEDNMRASDLPVWTCPTTIPQPTHTMEPDWELLTPPPTTYTPYPSATPYQLRTDFPLGKHVQIGTVGGIGLGIWVWMDNTQVDGPFSFADAATGAQTSRWVASWDITVENASWTADYEFYPFAQIYALEIIKADGISHTSGAWGISGEAHDLIDLPRLELTEEATLLQPGDQTTVRVAALIPAPDLWRMGYILDPLDTEDIEEMQQRHSLGSNVGVWVNTHDNECQNGEITAGAPGTPPAFGNLLIRHPVNQINITRGFGCTAFFTGEMGGSCPASRPWFHNGIDYAASQGAPYLDPLGIDGSVVYAGDNPTGPDCSNMTGSQPPHNGYGNYIKHTAIVDGHTVELWGAHLSSFNTTTGSSTSPGAILGAIGSTGCSDGPHLHFAVRVDGLYLDPCSLIPGGCS